MAKNSIYLDYASTTPVDPRVVQKMTALFSDNFGNPSGLYEVSRQAKSSLGEATEAIAKFLTCTSEELIFTSGGTESNNMAIFGLAKKFPGGHIITSKIEHDSVFQSCRELEKQGYTVTYLDVDEEGFIDLDKLKASITDETFLVSIIYANNEIGTIQQIAEISKIIDSFRNQKLEARGQRPGARGKESGIKKMALPFFHTDACQATGYLEMNVEKLKIDLMTINGSKIYGPKGVGALYIKSGTPLSPIIFGGGQQRGMRSGTENVPGIVGLAEAIKLVDRKQAAKEETLRDYMIKELLKIEDSLLNGPRENRLPNNVSISFLGAEGESAVLMLDSLGIACSTGSACSSSSLKGSHVIIAISNDDERAHCTLRFTLGRDTTIEQVDKSIKAVENVVKKLRQISGYKNGR